MVGSYSDFGFWTNAGHFGPTKSFLSDGTDGTLKKICESKKRNADDENKQECS